MQKASVPGTADDDARSIPRIPQFAAAPLADQWTNTGTIIVDEGTLNLGGTFSLDQLGTLRRTGGTVNVSGVLNLTGSTLALTGTVWLDRGGIINFVGSQTLGSGRIVFGNAAMSGFPCTMGVDSSTTLTLGPAVVVDGRHGLINGSGTLINQGLISADAAGGTLSIHTSAFRNMGTSECRNGGSLTIQSASWSNSSVLNASGAGALALMDSWTNSGTINVDGATLRLGGTFTLAQLGTLQRTGGTIEINGVLDLAGQTLDLNATTGSWQLQRGTIRAGTVRTSVGAKLSCVGNIPGTLDGVTYRGDLDVTSTLARVFIRNGLTLDGRVLLDRAGSIVFVGTQTLPGGTIVFGGPSPTGFSNSVNIQDRNTTLTLGQDVVLRGQVGTVTGSGGIINQGLIAADVARASVTVNPSQFQNDGTLRASAEGANLIVRVPAFTNTGKVEELNGGKVLINP